MINAKRIIVIAIILGVFSIGLSGQGTAIFHQDVNWSPDGKYLVFCGMHDLDKTTNSVKADIYVMRADGTGLKMISNPAINEFYSSWSNGRIAFGADVADQKGADIYSSDPDGGDLRQLTRDAKRNSTPAISKDGKKIAFISTRDSEKPQIYTMLSDGSGVARLTNDNNVGFYNPQWSPDGKQIVFYTEKGDRRDQVWVMKSDGSGQRLLTNNIGHNIFPSWSHDGKRILFSSSNRDQAADGSYIVGSYLYTINSDGTGLKKLSNIQSYFGRFSPNGKKIAYASGRFPATSIFIANADGTGAIKITH